MYESLIAEIQAKRDHEAARQLPGQGNGSAVSHAARPGALGSITRRKYAQTDLRVIAFKVSGYEYVVDVAQIHEIIRLGELLQISNPSETIAGLIKWRGRIVPIVDLYKCLGLRSSPRTPETCVIIARLSTSPVGFVVDSASELMWVKTYDFEVPTQVMAGIDQAYIQGVAHLSDRLLVMLDLERLLGSDGMQLPAPNDTAQKDHPETLYSGYVDTIQAEMGHRQIHADLHSLVTFELSGELYGVPITAVAEIREPLPLMPLPFVPPHVLGLINLRGVVLPVIDLRRKFGLPLHPNRVENRLVVLKGSGYQVALWVDAVHGLARLPETNFQPAPLGVARIDPEYYDQITTMDGRMVIELNVEKLLANTAAASEGPARS